MGEWQVAPTIVVRTTSFAWETEQVLRLDPRHARACVQGEERLNQLRSTVRASGHLPRGVLARLRSGRPLAAPAPFDARWQAEWNRAVAEAESASRSLDEQLSRELPRMTKAVHRIASDERFRAVLATTSPGVLHDVDAARWTGRLHRQVAAYIQRLTAKNETASFFGPVNYGRIGQELPAGISCHWSGPLTLTARRASTSADVLAALVAMAVTDDELAAWLCPRRRFARAPGRPAGSALLRELLPLADGEHTVGVLADQLGRCRGEVIAAFREGVTLGLLTHQLLPPASSVDPLSWLTARLAAIPVKPNGPLRAASSVLEVTRRFPAATADERVRLYAAVSRCCPARDAPASRPQFYGDRLPIHEACAGDLRLRIGGQRARELSECVAAALDPLAAQAVRNRDLANRAVARLIGARRLPFWKLVAALGDRPTPVDDELDRVVARLVARGAGDATEVELPRRAALVHPDAADSLVCSVDVLIDAPSVPEWSAGRYRLVLGDIHDGPLIGPWALQFHDTPEASRAEIAACVAAGGGTLPVVSVVGSRRTGLPVPEGDGPVIELGGSSGSAVPWRIPIDDLEVACDGQRAELRSARLGSAVRLATGELDSLAHAAFARPRIAPPRIRLATTTPRIIVGRTVLQRRCWTVRSPELAGLREAASERGLLLAAARLWEARGLPDLVFARSPSERKPVLVDLGSPLLLRLLARWSAATDALDLTELLPGPDGMWLRHDGGRHTAELRCVFVRTGLAT